ncbi:uncharacterized protein LOC135398244 [Ornithodoros turicata]|uniref:uncharacterized protein LOC135398244 n=1 Tax=Ornithodoros turicata TaxID=34597 RepID=UPI003139EE73
MKAPTLSGFIAVLLIVHCSDAQFKDLEGCSLSDLEACGTDYVVYANTTHLATGGEELKEQCKLFLDQLTCSDKLCARCLIGFPRVVSLVGLRNAHEFFEESCTDGAPLYKDYQKVIGCLNEAGAKIHERVTDIRLRLHTITKTIPPKQKVDYACCAYYNFRQATGDVIKSECPAPEVEKYYSSLMDKSFGELLGLACGEHTQGSRACRELGEVVPPESLTPEEASSFVGPMIDIIHSLTHRSA